DGYNFGTCSHGGTSYPSFDQVFHSTYNKLVSIAPAKPIMIAEVAADECGGDKGAWIKDMLTVQLPNNYPRVFAFVWWNWNNDGQLAINTSPGALSAFRQGISSSIYMSNVYSNLSVSPIPLP